MSHAVGNHILYCWASACACPLKSAHATTIRAGEITYRHLVGRTTYEVTITTYTEASVVADRPYLGLAFGATRGNGRTPSTACPASMDRLTPAGQAHIGEFIGGDVRLNLYTGTCTPISGPGVYTLRGRRPQPQLRRSCSTFPGPWTCPSASPACSSSIRRPVPTTAPSCSWLPPSKTPASASVWEHNPAAFRPRWRLPDL